MQKEERQKKRYRKIVVGIDQSYKNTGISIAADGNLIAVGSVCLQSFKTNTEKRKELSERLAKVLEKALEKAENVEVIFERIRLYSQGFINIDYIKSIGALNATIIDTCRKFGLGTYSVDTRAWKAQVIGSSKPKKNDYGVSEEKWGTICWVISKGFESNILMEVSKRREKGVIIKDGKRYVYNDDAADSAGIAMYGFVRKGLQNLKEEKG